MNKVIAILIFFISSFCYSQAADQFIKKHLSDTFTKKQTSPAVARELRILLNYELGSLDSKNYFLKAPNIQKLLIMAAQVNLNLGAKEKKLPLDTFWKKFLANARTEEAIDAEDEFFDKLESLIGPINTFEFTKHYLKTIPQSVDGALYFRSLTRLCNTYWALHMRDDYEKCSDELYGHAKTDDAKLRALLGKSRYYYDYPADLPKINQIHEEIFAKNLAPRNSLLMAFQIARLNLFLNKPKAAAQYGKALEMRAYSINDELGLRRLKVLSHIKNAEYDLAKKELAFIALRLRGPKDKPISNANIHGTAFLSALLSFRLGQKDAIGTELEEAFKTRENTFCTVGIPTDILILAMADYISSPKLSHYKKNMDFNGCEAMTQKLKIKDFKTQAFIKIGKLLSKDQVSQADLTQVRSVLKSLKGSFYELQVFEDILEDYLNYKEKIKT